MSVKNFPVLWKGISALLLFVFIPIAQASVPVPAPPDVAARNYILVDYASGDVLAEKKSRPED